MSSVVAVAICPRNVTKKYCSNMIQLQQLQYVGTLQGKTYLSAFAQSCESFSGKKY